MGLVALTLFYSAISIAYPRIIGYIIDAIQHGLTDPAHFVISTLWNLVLLLVGPGSSVRCPRTFRPLAYMISGARFLWGTRNMVFRSVLDQGFTFTNRYPSGDVQERLDQDLNDVAQFSAMGIFWPMTSVLTMAFALVILIRMKLAADRCHPGADRCQLLRLPPDRTPRGQVVAGMAREDVGDQQLPRILVLRYPAGQGLHDGRAQRRAPAQDPE